MTQIGIPPRSKDDWDVPLSHVEQQVRDLVVRQRAQAKQAATNPKAGGRS